MRRRSKAAIAITVILFAGCGTGAALAVGGDDEGTLAGADAQRATAAALAITGGGTANAVERDAEHGATYEVEVTKPNGATVDVRLDASFDLVVIDADSESQGEANGAS